MKRAIPRPTEAALQREVLDRLDALEALGKLMVLRHNAGTFRAHGHHVRGARKGTPDVQVLLPGQRTMFIECKGPKTETKLSQVAWHAKARALGHVVVIARTVDEAMDPVRAALRENAA